MLLINLIGVVLTACIAGACIVVVMGIIFDFLGFYDRMEKMEHHLDNDEYDYGHDVKYHTDESKSKAMEAEQYFKCPICGKRHLKRKGIKLTYSMVCNKCYNSLQDYYEIRRRKEYEKV